MRVSLSEIAFTRLSYSILIFSFWLLALCSLGLCPRELLKAKGYIGPYMLSRVIIRIAYHFNSNYGNDDLNNLIDN